MIDPSSSEQIWEVLLSRNPDAIRRAFLMLDQANRWSVLDHLHKMAVDPGWHAEQVISAQIALETLQNINE